MNIIDTAQEIAQDVHKDIHLRNSIDNSGWDAVMEMLESSPLQLDTEIARKLLGL